MDTAVQCNHRIYARMRVYQKQRHGRERFGFPTKTVELGHYPRRRSIIFIKGKLECKCKIEQQKSVNLEDTSCQFLVLIQVSG